MKCDSQTDCSIHRNSLAVPGYRNAISRHTTRRYRFLDRSPGCCAFRAIRGGYILLLVFRLHGRKQKHFLDVNGVCEKHRDAVDAHAPAARGRQPVLQGGAEGFIYEHGLVVASGLGRFFKSSRCRTGSFSSV